jgi:hypothetical protein
LWGEPRGRTGYLHAGSPVYPGVCYDGKSAAMSSLPNPKYGRDDLGLKEPSRG